MDGQDAEALLGMDADGSLTLTSFRFITRSEQCPMVVHKLACAEIHAIHLENDRLVSSLNLHNTPSLPEELPPPGKCLRARFLDQGTRALRPKSSFPEAQRRNGLSGL